MENVLELTNVSKQFKDFSIEPMDLKVKQGLVTGFIGANGAGKTTTMKMMMNLMQPDTGDVQVFGQNYSIHEKAIKERIGFVYDENIFFELMNLKDIRRVVGPAYKQWDDALFHHYVRQFDLPMTKAIKTFSKGMQMKASLAIALSHHAELIIMDEPTAGLDPVFRRELLDLLRELMTDGHHTLFFSTHMTTDLDRIADYIALMNDGKLVFHQSMHEVADHYALVKGSNDLLDSDTQRAFLHVQQAATGFEALTNNIQAVQQIFGDSVMLEPASLEDIMYYMKGEASHA